MGMKTKEENSTKHQISTMKQEDTWSHQSYHIYRKYLGRYTWASSVNADQTTPSFNFRDGGGGGGSW